MHDDLEKRLASLRESYPTPSSGAEAHTRSAFIASGQRPSSAWRWPHVGRERAIFAVIFAATVALAFAAGFLLAPGGAAAKATVSAGPGFLPASGWNTASTGVTGPPRAPTALATNVPIANNDAAMTAPPAATIHALGASGVLLFATFYTAIPGTNSPRGFPPRTLPLRLAQAVQTGTVEGFQNTGLTERVEALVAGYDIDLLVFFGASKPSADVRAAADAEIAELVVPQCPIGNDVVTAADANAAVSFLHSWLATRYSGFAVSLLQGSRLSADVVADDPRERGEIAAQCGRAATRRMMSVQVAFSGKARAVVGNAPIAFLVFRQNGQWQMWRQANP